MAVPSRKRDLSTLEQELLGATTRTALLDVARTLQTLEQEPQRGKTTTEALHQRMQQLARLRARLRTRMATLPETTTERLQRLEHGALFAMKRLAATWRKTAERPEQGDDLLFRVRHEVDAVLRTAHAWRSTEEQAARDDVIAAARSGALTAEQAGMHGVAAELERAAFGLASPGMAR